MATLNVAPKTRKSKVFTAEGAPAKIGTGGQQLARLVNACMLWEDNFYVDGQTVAQLIANYVKAVPPEVAQTIAIKARTEQKLRHVPLLVVREMARASKAHRLLVADTLAQVIQRPDELSEFLAIYWKDKKEPLSAQVKKGLARAFGKFNEYSLAKYNRDNPIKLRDVAFLSHPKPTDKESGSILARLVNKDHFPKKTKSGYAIAKNYGKYEPLTTPDTWEVALSGGADKKETFTRLIEEEKLGALAVLRNLRKMTEVGVDEDLIRNAITSMKTERVLPFRFISAAKYAPQFEPQLETAMFKCLEEHDKLEGTTVLLVDVSGSMDAPISAKSDLQRADAAAGLAMLLREVCENVKVYTFSHSAVAVPPRRGFALAEAIKNSQSHGSTYLGASVQQVANLHPKMDRLIVISDEQAHDPVVNPFVGMKKAYMINVATNQYGVAYGNGWSRIDGWSEACVDYIQAEENEDED